MAITSKSVSDSFMKELFDGLKCNQADNACEKQIETTQFARNKTRQRSLRETNRDNAVCEKQTATTQFAKRNNASDHALKTKRDDAILEQKSEFADFFSRTASSRLSLQQKRSEQVFFFCTPLFPTPTLCYMFMILVFCGEMKRREENAMCLRR